MSELKKGDVIEGCDMDKYGVIINEIIVNGITKFKVKWIKVCSSCCWDIGEIVTFGYEHIRSNYINIGNIYDDDGLMAMVL